MDNCHSFECWMMLLTHTTCDFQKCWRIVFKIFNVVYICALGLILTSTTDNSVNLLLFQDRRFLPFATGCYATHQCHFLRKSEVCGPVQATVYSWLELLNQSINVLCLVWRSMNTLTTQCHFHKGSFFNQYIETQLLLSFLLSAFSTWVAQFFYVCHDRALNCTGKWYDTMGMVTFMSVLQWWCHVFLQSSSCKNIVLL